MIAFSASAFLGWLLAGAAGLPRYLTPDPATLYKTGPQFGTTGIDADVVAAARQALKEMIDYLTAVHGITPCVTQFSFASSTNLI